MRCIKRRMPSFYYWKIYVLTLYGLSHQQHVKALIYSLGFTWKNHNSTSILIKWLMEICFEFNTWSPLTVRTVNNLISNLNLDILRKYVSFISIKDEFKVLLLLSDWSQLREPKIKNWLYASLINFANLPYSQRPSLCSEWKLSAWKRPMVKDLWKIITS